MAIALLGGACSGSTSISSVGPVADTVADDGETASAETTSPTPTPVATATPSSDASTTQLADTPDTWSEHDLGTFALALPSDWQTMTSADEVEPVISAAEDLGAEFPRQAVSQFQALLENGNAIIAIGDGGDNVNAFRQFGLAQSLVEHELIVDELTNQFAGFASNVDFVSEPRMFAETPGVLIKGSYDVEGDTAFMYQFLTHEGTYLYFFTVTLYDGDDPGLASDLFRSIQIG